MSSFGDDEFYDDSSCSNEEVLKQLTFPYTKHEPVVEEAELQRLDSLADALEIERLTAMNVLTSSADMPSDSKVLSTRFVRTWREKLRMLQVSRYGCGAHALWRVNMPGWKESEVICFPQLPVPLWQGFCPPCTWK